MVDVATAAVTPLVHTRRAESSPFFSPDGRSIAYVASDDPPTWAFDSASIGTQPRGNAPQAGRLLRPPPRAPGLVRRGERLLYPRKPGHDHAALCPAARRRAAGVRSRGGRCRRGVLERDPQRGGIRLPDGGPARRGIPHASGPP